MSKILDRRAEVHYSYLCIVAFILSFFAIGKERWHFGAIVFYAGFFLLFALAVLAIIIALHAWA